MLKTISMAVCLLFAAGCSASTSPTTHMGFERKMDVRIAPSAIGWKVDIGVDELHTVLVNPRGQSFDVGETTYPGYTQAELMKIRVEELNADFLILHRAPEASAASIITIFTILPDDVPFRAADVHRHWEWEPPCGWKNWLFVDLDGDGIRELRDDDTYLEGGTMTYYSFEKGRFSPVWVEKYEIQHNPYKLVLVSTRRID